MNEILITPGHRDRDTHVITPEELFSSSEIIEAEIVAYKKIKSLILKQGVVHERSVLPELFDKLNAPLDKLLRLWQAKSSIVFASQHLPQYNWKNTFGQLRLEDEINGQSSGIYFSPKKHNSIKGCNSVFISITNRSYYPTGSCSFQLDLLDKSVGLLTGTMNLTDGGTGARCTFSSSRISGNHIHTMNIELDKEIKDGMRILTVIGKEEYEMSKIGFFVPKVTSNFEILDIRKPLETLPKKYSAI